ncbi:MAG TPA: cupin domain-containing protein [Burkholderiales bacterium]|nr:cupin domain-containing protein [Burkholderiales bacterium]
MPSPGPRPALTEFATRQLPAAPDIVAPDGSDVRVLLRTANGSMAHFELAAGRASDPIRHRTVEEIWYVLAGTGEIWRKQGEREEIVPLVPGTCITIPRGTHFQFRASAAAALSAIGITMPPWPGADEAIAVAGIWRPG